jgi:hypothetical protein
MEVSKEDKFRVSGHNFTNSLFSNDETGLIEHDFTGSNGEDTNSKLHVEEI